MRLKFQRLAGRFDVNEIYILHLSMPRFVRPTTLAKTELVGKFLSTSVAPPLRLLKTGGRKSTAKTVLPLKTRLRKATSGLIGSTPVTLWTTCSLPGLSPMLRKTLLVNLLMHQMKSRHVVLTHKPPGNLPLKTPSTSALIHLVRVIQMPSLIPLRL